MIIDLAREPSRAKPLVKNNELRIHISRLALKRASKPNLFPFKSYTTSAVVICISLENCTQNRPRSEPKTLGKKQKNGKLRVAKPDDDDITQQTLFHWITCFTININATPQHRQNILSQRQRNVNKSDLHSSCSRQLSGDYLWPKIIWAERVTHGSIDKPNVASERSCSSLVSLRWHTTKVQWSKMKLKVLNLAPFELCLHNCAGNKANNAHNVFNCELMKPVRLSLINLVDLRSLLTPSNVSLKGVAERSPKTMQRRWRHRRSVAVATTTFLDIFMTFLGGAKSICRLRLEINFVTESLRRWPKCKQHCRQRSWNCIRSRQIGAIADAINTHMGFAEQKVCNMENGKVLSPFSGCAISAQSRVDTDELRGESRADTIKSFRRFHAWAQLLHSTSTRKVQQLFVSFLLLRIFCSVALALSRQATAGTR